MCNENCKNCCQIQLYMQPYNIGINQKYKKQSQMGKKKLYKLCSIENLKREIKIQKKLQHPHIIKLNNYFEDNDNVYLILEYAGKDQKKNDQNINYIENGSLFQFLRKRGKLPESEAFIYFFQTCIGIDYLHKNNLIHRDIKPENLLLDKQGNIKICDFGWSDETNQISERAQALCGTWEYMAPEMIQKLPHNQSLDIWCLGILLYELVHGQTPFRSKNDQEVSRQILSFKPIVMEQSLSREIKHLIQSILKYRPEERILMEHIFKHEWFIQMSEKYNLKIDQYIFKMAKPFITSTSTQFIRPLMEQPETQRRSLANQNFENTFIPPNNLRNPPVSSLPSLITPNSDRRVSMLSNRNHIYSQSLVEIQSQNQVQIQEKSFIDKFLSAFGCMKRDKN